MKSIRNNAVLLPCLIPRTPQAPIHRSGCVHLGNIPFHRQALIALIIILVARVKAFAMPGAYISALV